MNHLTFAGLHFLKQEKFLKALEEGIPDVKPIGPTRILYIVAGYFQTDPSDLLGKGRKKEIREPRHWAIYLMYHHCYIGGYKNIAKFMGMNHASVFSAEKKIGNHIRNYDNYKKDYLQLIKRIQDD